MLDTCICWSRDIGRAPPVQSIFIDRWIKVTGDVLHGAVHFPALAAAGPASAIGDRHPALTMCEGEQTRRSGRAKIKARVLHRSFGTGTALWIANVLQRRRMRCSRAPPIIATSTRNRHEQQASDIR